ncbi:S8 family serine peptidase [Photobacterium lipolyticum]|uniref:Peptidase S8 n=1 Tax=Photobacterium lipolyticum TaxID=266810 RepID=A0A2T3MVM2_9GAMM|nr:S8 family serine peptidase [Photobacterium lipolyticum]PSW04018.1 peptidase S8 [Photobacterium lipolyticum]
MRIIPTALAVLIASSPAFAQNSEPLTDQIIVKYRTDSPMMRAEVSASNSATQLQQMVDADVQYVRSSANDTHILKVPAQSDLKAVIEQLNQNPNIEYAEPDRIMWPTAIPNDPEYVKQWHYSSSISGINLPKAWDLTTGGSDVIVAVIDTGIQPEHPDLMNNLLPGYDFIKNAAAARDGDGRDADATDEGDWLVAGQCGQNYPPRDRNSSWHGTHVAGTVAAEGNNGQGVTGVAWSTSIVPVRVLGACGGYTSDITDGMRWAAGLPVAGAPANPYPAKVLNLSLGGKGACGITYQQAINDVRTKGAAVVVAAGNDNQNVRGFTPGNCQGVISVASNNKTGGRAFYSNYGSMIDIAAPGGGRSGGILSTHNSGTRQAERHTYKHSMGTSMAAPHVAGIAALMYSLDTSLTPDQIEQYITETARPFPAGSTCNTTNCGAGITDTFAALQRVKGIKPAPGPNPQPGTVDCSGLSVWSAGNVYLEGEQARQNGIAYQAKWWNQNQPPAENTADWGVWTLLGQCQ